MSIGRKWHGSRVVSDGDQAEIGTTITLSSLKPSPRERFYGSEPLTQTFSAANVRSHADCLFAEACEPSGGPE
jgi:hypothetical protein